MKSFNTALLTLALLCSSAHIFGGVPTNEENQQSTQEQREQEARDRIVQNMQRQMEIELPALEALLQALPTPDQFAASLTQTLSTLNNNQSANE
jgi:hypothetical protein